MIVLFVNLVEVALYQFVPVISKFTVITGYIAPIKSNPVLVLPVIVCFVILILLITNRFVSDPIGL